MFVEQGRFEPEQWQGRFAEVVRALGLHRLAFANNEAFFDAALEAEENLAAYYLTDGLSNATTDVIMRREFLRSLDAILQPLVDAACRMQRPELESQILAAAKPGKDGAKDFLDPAKWNVKGGASIEDEAYVLGCAAAVVALQNQLLLADFNRKAP